MKGQTIKYPKQYLRAIDTLERKFIVTSKSEAIRESLKDFVQEIEQELSIITILSELSNRDTNKDGISASMIPKKTWYTIENWVHQDNLFASVSEFCREAMKHYLIKQVKQFTNKKESTFINSEPKIVKVPNGDGTHTVHNIKGVA